MAAFVGCCAEVPGAAHAGRSAVVHVVHHALRGDRHSRHYPHDLHFGDAAPTQVEEEEVISLYLRHVVADGGHQHLPEALQEAREKDIRGHIFPSAFHTHRSTYPVCGILAELFKRLQRASPDLLGPLPFRRRLSFL
ncbi:hypothetical protein B484DRAFT_18963 [Ochromonadaceae sp. CCMP2298]|nr:hypothetical protein B484DRAFT_18963 [Ochromonadaceae sp. CCMP2298]